MVEGIVVNFDGLAIIAPVDDPMTEKCQIIRAGDFRKLRVVEATVQEIFEGICRRIQLLLELFFVRFGSQLILENGGRGSDARHVRISNRPWRVVESVERDLDG